MKQKGEAFLAVLCDEDPIEVGPVLDEHDNDHREHDPKSNQA